VSRWIYLAGYLLGAAVVGRVTFVHLVNHEGRSEEGDEMFAAVIAAVLWPLLAGLAAVLAPFLAAGWAFSRPTRKERAAAAVRRASEQRAAVAKLEREFNLPNVDGQS
jgi:hypothetical protein